MPPYSRSWVFSIFDSTLGIDLSRLPVTQKLTVVSLYHVAMTSSVEDIGHQSATPAESTWVDESLERYTNPRAFARKNQPAPTPQLQEEKILTSSGGEAINLEVSKFMLYRIHYVFLAAAGCQDSVAMRNGELWVLYGDRVSYYKYNFKFSYFFVTVRVDSVHGALSSASLFLRVKLLLATDLLPFPPAFGSPISRKKNLHLRHLVNVACSRDNRNLTAPPDNVALCPLGWMGATRSDAKIQDSLQKNSVLHFRPLHCTTVVVQVSIIGSTGNCQVTSIESVHGYTFVEDT